VQGAIDQLSNSYNSIQSGFGNNFNTNGYQKLPSGLIIQWGVISYPDIVGTASLHVTYPITFPTTVFHIFQSVDSSQQGLSLMHDNLTSSSVNLRVTESDQQMVPGNLRYLVLGY
jgi:hypothetical protein